MSWDYIIVGAGSAGCALAYELTRCRPKDKILILEAGGSDHSPFIKFPAGQIRAVATHDWGYRSQPDPSRNGVIERWPRGRVLGGCSSINGTMYVRGAAEDFNRWASHGGDMAGWSAESVLPIFREIETSDQSGPTRGRNGPLHVRTVKHPHRLTQAFIEAAQACGYPYNKDYNGESQEGVSFAQLSQRRGLRCSAADAFLKRLHDRRNVKLILDAHVRKIDLQRQRAVAVRFASGGVERREAAREIILCAGAINSPKILLLSGIGDSQELRRYNIDIALDLPGVGRNLREHPCVKLIYRAKVPTYNLTEGAGQKLAIAAKYIMSGEGPISNIFEGAAFLKSNPSMVAPDIQLHFLPLGYLTKPDGSLQFAPFPSVTVLLNKSHPVSAGRIRLSSGDPDDAPLVECRLLEDGADVDTLIQGVHVVRGIMQQQPLAALLGEEVSPGIQVEGLSALREYVRGHTDISFHPAGTCRMGTGADAVVAPNLRVHGMENLWVADASIMPDLISGNTNAVCMMIGMKLGKQFGQRSYGERWASQAT